VVINDAQGLLLPALDFKLYQMTISMLKTPTILKVGGNLQFGLSYFNPLPSKMEPIIEKFGSDFEVTMAENPQMAVVLRSTDIMNINVSNTMLSTLYGMTMSLNQDYQREMKELEEQKQQESKVKKSVTNLMQEVAEEEEVEDLIDYVSPYTIFNDTGYTV